MNKELYILRNINITNNKVVCDGRILYSDDPKSDFKVFSRNLYRKLNCSYSKFFKMDNLCKLTFLANEFIVRDIRLDQYDKEETAVILSNSSSTLNTDKIFAETIHSIPSPAIFVYTLPNIAIGELSIRTGWKGENLFLVEKSFDPGNLFDQVALLFASSQTGLCLTGWTDYISPTDYQACLWLVTDSPDEKNIKFTPIEMMNNFSV
ncbi:MAG: hypothetical protein PVF73_03775 [Bacteroidales bacterium]